MNFIDKDKLPVEIQNKELPEEKNKNYEMFYDYRVRTSGGFASAIFLAAVMLTCFMWGMIVIQLIK